MQTMAIEDGTSRREKGQTELQTHHSGLSLAVALLSQLRVVRDAGLKHDVWLLAVITYLLSPVAITNLAGRVVVGEFGGVTNRTFVVSGRSYPLGILPESEQRRIKALAGQDVRTAKQKRQDQAREMRLERIRVREAEGEIDSKTAERLRREASGTTVK